MKVSKCRYDLLTLDLMLPGMQGFELCRILRDDPQTEDLPIIILTAKDQEVDRILGLEMGADDYMTKPFSPRELIARVKAVLRRTQKPTLREELEKIGEIQIDNERYKVYVRGQPVKLSATEFKILQFLVQRRGKICTRDQLLNSVWQEDSFLEPRKVDVHIRRLRTIIEKDPANPKHIQTLRGVGYFFERQDETES
jgi:DNA-binding response OmpR family regulator